MKRIMFLMVFLVLFASSVTAVSNEGLVSCWDHDIGVYDLVGDNDYTANECTFASSAETKLGNATYCNAQKVTLDITKTNIPAGGNFTICSWVYITVAPASTATGVYYWIGDSAITPGSPGTTVAYMYNDDSASKKGIAYGHINNDYMGNGDTTIQTWEYMCVTYDDDTDLLNWYEDGNIKKNVTQAMSLDTDVFYFGGRGDAYSLYSKFYMDETVLFNRTLSSAEIIDLTNGGTGVTCSDIAPSGSSPIGEIITQQVNPPDAILTNEATSYFIYNVTSTNSSIDNCTLSIDGVHNQTAEDQNWSTTVSMVSNGYNFSTNTFTSGDREVSFITATPFAHRRIVNTSSPVADGWTGLFATPTCTGVVYNKIQTDLTNPGFICINLTTALGEIYVMEILNAASDFTFTKISTANANVNNNTDNNFSLSLPEGTFNWAVSCYDEQGHSSNTTNRSITIDRFNFTSLTYNSSDYFEYSGMNYTRNLSYSLVLTCDNATTPLDTYINGALNSTTNITCTQTEQIINGLYNPFVEGEFNITFMMAGEYTDNYTFSADLNSPVISGLSFGLTPGFGVDFENTTINVTCSDTIMPYVTLNFSINVFSLYFGNITSNTSISNSSNAISDGNNTLYAYCADPFSVVSATANAQIYAKNISLIDELDNTYFNLANVTGARVYHDDNSTFYDFKTNSRNNISYVSLNNSKLRFELIYDDAVIIRYIDLSLTSGDLRVCANKEGVTHYEQLIVSALERAVVLKSVFSNCYVAADYTRFAYQDALVLKAYTINTMYYLYTITGTTQVLLASLDGSLSTYINIDTLEFNARGYNLDIFGDSMTFEKTGATEIMIRYQNIANDNTYVNVTIDRMDTNERVLANPTILAPNNFTLYFDYSTLANVTNNTLFRIQMDKTKEDNGIETSKRYFNTQAGTGIIQTGVGFFIAFLLMVFGLTFAISRVTFSWFGIFITLASLAVLSVTITTWVITFMMAVDTIILVFIVILLVKQNYPTVS